MSEKKRPSIWHPIERAKYDALMTTYRDFEARMLTDDERQTYDVDLPPSWREQPMQVLRNVMGVSNKPPVGSGAGFVQVPYMDIFTKVYGVTPIADLAKYRQIYRNQPDVMHGIEMQVNLSVGKGFSIEHPDNKVVEYLKNASEQLGLYRTMLVMASDMLVYGNSYVEICWDKLIEGKEPLYEIDGQAFTKEEIVENFPDRVDDIKPAMVDIGKIILDEVKGELIHQKFELPQPFVAQRTKKSEEAETIIQLKPLDPVYMRVRRDAYNNIYGYIQWLVWPPALIDPDSMIHVKYREKSWAYESAYGTSTLMPMIKNNDLYNQFENDAAIWIHGRAVPPLIVKGGTPEKPYTTPQMEDLMKKLKGRGAASMVYTKGDVDIKEVEGAARALNVQWWIDLLLVRRYQALGIPPVFMGMKENISRGTGEVIFQEFTTRLQLIQQLMGEAIETNVLYPLIIKKFGDKYKGKIMPRAKIVWKPIVEEDRNMRAQRLIQALQAGAISVNEYRREMGFNIINKPEYEKLNPISPLGTPSGDPAQDKEKGGGAKAPTKRIKPSPEGKSDE
jgi:hypothetical protein